MRSTTRASPEPSPPDGRLRVGEVSTLARNGASSRTWLWDSVLKRSKLDLELAISRMGAISERGARATIRGGDLREADAPPRDELEGIRVAGNTTSCHSGEQTLRE